MKRIIMAIFAFVIVSICLFTLNTYVWDHFKPLQIVGSTVETQSQNLQAVTTEWLDSFFKQYMNSKAPFEYRLDDVRVKEITILDVEQGYVQLDYEIKPVSDNDALLIYYNAYNEADGWYNAQFVLKFEKIDRGYQVIEKLLPVQYQIAHDPSVREEPPALGYAIGDKDETYYFQNKKLYITFNNGSDLIEVPMKYEDIAKTNNGTYNERLPEHGYIVSKAFTAFIGYNEQGSYMYYSKDQGNTWQTLGILPITYRGESVYLSQFNDTCYITLACDRSLGHEYYNTYKTVDLRSWEELHGEVFKDRSNVVFVDQMIGYISAGKDGAGQALVNYTIDDGINYQTITIPPQNVSPLEGMTPYNPFVEMEYVYKQDQKTYMIIGQGQDGDYTKNNVLVKARYVSDDGIHFTFDTEIFEDHPLAG